MAKILLRDRPEPLPKKPELLCPTCIHNRSCQEGRRHNYHSISCSEYKNIFTLRKFPHIRLGPQHVETVRIQED
jgi:hypothetical protein